MTCRAYVNTGPTILDPQHQRILSLRDRVVQFALQHNRPEIAAMFEALRARSDVGMTRRVDALSSLEQLGQGYPQPQHEVSMWFKPSLARRLQAANLRQIADLTALANRRGSSWWRTVPRIGPQSAEIITNWLMRQRQPMGEVAIRAYVLPPSAHAHRAALVPLALGPGMPYPVPLERMFAPDQNTVAGPALAADLAFVQGWLRARATHTRSSYRREAERLLLWSAGRGKDLGMLGAEDIELYEAFLADPQPSSFWCGPSGPRDKMHWRPFEGPLSAGSVAAALRVIWALLRAMAKAGHRARLPAAAQRAARAPVIPASPALAPAEIAAFLEWLGDSGASAQHRAARAVAMLVHVADMRLTELAGLRCACLQVAEQAKGLKRPGSRRRQVTLDDATWQALQAHWADRGWTTTTPPAQAALLAPVVLPATERGRNKRLAGDAAGYSASGLDQLLRRLWGGFCDVRGMTSEGFTPTQLRVREVDQD